MELSSHNSEKMMVKLQIFGTGCAKCQMLGKHAEAAAKALGLDYELEKVTDLNAIIAAGVMATPALAVDGDVKVSGRVPTVDTLKSLLRKATGPERTTT
jgi:small redox-active disulfide protein 2